VFTFSGAAGRGACTPGRSLESASTHFIQTFKIRVFHRNFGQNMPKNAYFLEKKAGKSPQRTINLREFGGPAGGIPCSNRRVETI